MLILNNLWGRGKVTQVIGLGLVVCSSPETHPKHVGVKERVSNL